jgi:hypothetical protein
MRAGAPLTAIALTLDLPTSPDAPQPTNVNPVLPDNAGHDAAVLEDPHVFGNHAGTLGFGIDPPALPARRETLTTAAVSAIPAATANVRFEPLPG